MSADVGGALVCIALLMVWWAVDAWGKHLDRRHERLQAEAGRRERAQLRVLHPCQLRRPEQPLREDIERCVAQAIALTRGADA